MATAHLLPQESQESPGTASKPQESDAKLARGSESPLLRDGEDKAASWGKTSDGRVFRVPVTQDMLQNLFTHVPPSLRTHTYLELATLAVVFAHSLTFLVVLGLGVFAYGGDEGEPWIGWGWRVYFTVVFLLWRTAYNAGLGYMLKRQSESHWFTNLCKASGYFDEATASKTERGKRIHALLRNDFTKKLGPDYSFSEVPIEFNAWLLYRNIVDLILVNDFTAYIIFVFAFTSVPVWAELDWTDALRYGCGLALIAFNLWVKKDAHRVVKDFAWYWGDFFFLIDVNLTFDGVFEMAPHPMYSVGYAGYYGLSLISNSGVVLCVSLVAHAAQFLFLYLVEEPHIQKTYGGNSAKSFFLTTDLRAREILYGGDPHHSYFDRDLIVLWNFDWFRSSDLFLLWSLVFTGFLALPLERIGLNLPAWFFVALALSWRCIHTFGLGWILRWQSKKKMWTRHFIRIGGSNRDAFFSWKSLYNFSLTMTYFTFLLAAMKGFTMPLSMSVADTFWLRQMLGTLLIGLHMYMSYSVYQVLGDFGWFYGDFFIDEFPVQLQYNGIYRYLNNPERILGHAAFWGAAIMSGNTTIAFMAVFSLLTNWWFLENVEEPHMRKTYGSKMRKQSGVTKTFKNQLTDPVIRKLEQQKIVGDVNQMIRDLNKIGSDVVSKVERLVAGNIKTEMEKVMELAKPKIDDLLADTRVLLADTTSRLATLGAQSSKTYQDIEVKGLEEYAVRLEAKSPTQKHSERGSVTFELGEPITIEWKAPEGHSTRDWIGMYKVTANPSAAATTTSSNGKWKYLESEGAEGGSVEFDGDLLPWEVGVYECRLHLDDKYSVLAKSGMFEIKVTPVPPLDDSLFIIQSPRASGESLETGEEESLALDARSPLLTPTNPNSLDSIIATLLQLYRRALQMPSLTSTTNLLDPSLKPEPTPAQAQRIVYGIKLMYGVDLDWRVVLRVEPRVEQIAERIQEARVILAPATSSWVLHQTSDNEKDNDFRENQEPGMTVAKFMRLIEKDRERKKKKQMVGTARKDA